jgi:hypothetical protein
VPATRISFPARSLIARGERSSTFRVTVRPSSAVVRFLALPAYPPHTPNTSENAKVIPQRDTSSSRQD